MSTHIGLSFGEVRLCQNEQIAAHFEQKQLDLCAIFLAHAFAFLSNSGTTSGIRGESFELAQSETSILITGFSCLFAGLRTKSER
ncbi:hypothetical protein BpHYR1_002910 [Brachionus plicatilis]|uniref:Uncharacterized protein n=1 Tax=Brachionus plicatilis TaxID=10195 RepID=A0A3M7PVR9_BRAPC|nr:hypothetical protein BpHYR1_002910 [Brachionus plicatilis]